MGKPRKNPTKTLKTNPSILPFPISEQLQPNILETLPVKSLLQFRSVSKKWQSIIDSPNFSHTHFSRAENRPGGARILFSFSNPDRTRHYLYSAGLYGGRAVHHLTLPNDGTAAQNGGYFLSPVKGLVCFLTDRKIFICNPSTRKVRIVPPCSTISQNNSFNKSYLYKPYSSYSFGFDSFSRVFKFLHISGTICRHDNKLYNIESSVFTIKTPDVFGLNSFSWRKIGSAFPYPYPFRSQGVCVNDCIYWVGLKSPGEENIISFNLQHEKFSLIPSPPNGVPSKSKLENIEGNLGIMSFKDYGDFSLELWVYKNSNWVNLEIGNHHHIIALKKKGMNTNFPTFVGNYYTGGMLLTQDVLHHNFVLRSLNGGRAWAQARPERGVKFTGLPGWIDLVGYKKVSFCTANYVESITPLDWVLRLGDFTVDLAAARQPKQPVLMKLLPAEEVSNATTNKEGKEWKNKGLIFGDLEVFQRDKTESDKESLKSISSISSRSTNGKWVKKVKGKAGLEGGEHRFCKNC